MKILLFGGSGQLGYEIQKRASDLNFEVVSPVTSEVNISEEKQVKFLVEETRPGLIINCAAYTAVDKAETDQEACYKINREGAAIVAKCAQAASARLIHISTDYVFDGNLGRSLVEEDQACPINVYGKSKLEGEDRILKIFPEGSLVVRTSSLYGQRGVNFVRTMLELFRTKELVRVVDDQYSSPTWAGWLAEVLLDLGRMRLTGVIHAVCEGQVSWFGFAQKILELSSPILKPKPTLRLEPIKAVEFARPAPRPKFSVLNCSKLTTILGRPPIGWEDALKAYLVEIGMMVE